MHPLLKKPGPELVNDILMSMDISHVTFLVVLDVGAASDTVDPSIFFPFVRSWMINDKLMLKNDNTVFPGIGTSKQLSKVSVISIRAGDDDVITVHSAKNLGSWFDSHMDMATHTAETCSSAFFHVHNI